jgi:ABC-type xylose transport system permease subunit
MRYMTTSSTKGTEQYTRGTNTDAEERAGVGTDTRTLKKPEKKKTIPENNERK